MAQTSRRELFGRFFRAAPTASPADGVASLVRAYLSILERLEPDLPWGLPASLLPAPAEEIRAAILTVARARPSEGAAVILGDAAASLEWFVEPEDLVLLREDRATIERAREVPPADWGAVTTSAEAVALRSRVVAAAERTREHVRKATEDAALRVRPAEPDDLDQLAAIASAVRRLDRADSSVKSGATTTEKNAERVAPAARDAAGEGDASAMVEGCDAALRSEEEALLVITLGREVLGYCRVRHPPPDSTEAELLDLAIAPHARGRGRARRLVESSFAALATEGVTTVVARSLPPGATPSTLMERLGFSLTDVELAPPIWRCSLPPPTSEDSGT